MDGEGVREILAARSTPSLVDVGGVKRLFVPVGGTEDTWKEVAAGPDVGPAPVHLFTLTGLVDYITANRDQLPLEQCVVHVANHAEVHLLGKLQDAPFHRRNLYAQANFAPLLGQGFQLSAYYDRETFNVALQTLFVDTPARAKVLAIVGNLKEEQVRQSTDDGTTQTVTGRAGIVLGKDVEVPNPVPLQPYRTFREITQPESKFVLRLRSGKEGELPSCALFEADGGAWKLEAMLKVRDYLVAKLSTTTLAVLA